MTAPAPSIGAALQTVIAALHPTAVESVGLHDALSRVLASDVTATFDIPPWTNASMDGYACYAADLAPAGSAPVRLPVAETIAAGSFPSRPLARGEAMRIMTGAPLPEGADSVVRVEDTDGGTATVTVRSARDALSNIRRRGEDLRAGQLAVGRGSTIRPAEIAMLAAVGVAAVPVHARPRVAILSSGDELVSVEDAAALADGRKIVSANNYSLAAIVRQSGGEPVDLGIVPDDLALLRDAMRRGSELDLLVTSGGVSVGGFDFTRAAAEALGADMKFWRMPMRPGYNTAFGLINDTPWIGVPGNPVSALVAGEVVVAPAVRALAGARAPFRLLRWAIASEPLRGSGESTVFLRGILEYVAGDRPRATLAGAQGSAILSSSVRADALLLIAAGREQIGLGEDVPFLLLRDEGAFSETWP